MDPLLGGALIGAGGNLLGGLLGSSGASAQRNWEERMMNTQYQRASADMIKAGLNPAMMYMGKGGPTGGIPTPPNVGEKMGEGVSAAAQAAMQYQLNKAQVAAQSASASQARALAERTQKEADYYEHTVNLTDAQTEYAKAQTAVANGVVMLNSAQTGKIAFDEDMIRSNIAENLVLMGLQREQAKKIASEKNLTDIQTILAQLGVPKAKMEAGFFDDVNKFTGGIPKVNEDLKKFLNWLQYSTSSQPYADVLNALKNFFQGGAPFGGISSAGQGAAFPSGNSFINK